MKNRRKKRLIYWKTLLLNLKVKKMGKARKHGTSYSYRALVMKYYPNYFFAIRCYTIILQKIVWIINKF